MDTTTRFSLGQIFATPGALKALGLADDDITPATLLTRHAACDWGDVCDEDRQLNDESLKDGSRLLSAYRYGKTTFWVITEAVGANGQRHCTTILLPEEY